MAELHMIVTEILISYKKVDRLKTLMTLFNLLGYLYEVDYKQVSSFKTWT